MSALALGKALFLGKLPRTDAPWGRGAALLAAVWNVLLAPSAGWSPAAQS